MNICVNVFNLSFVLYWIVLQIDTDFADCYYCCCCWLTVALISAITTIVMSIVSPLCIVAGLLLM